MNKDELVKVLQQKFLEKNQVLMLEVKVMDEMSKNSSNKYKEVICEQSRASVGGGGGWMEKFVAAHAHMWCIYMCAVVCS